MKLRRQFLIAGLVVLSLFLTSSFVAAQTTYHGKTTTIDIYVPGHITGNSGGENTSTPNLFQDNIVPQFGNDADVYENTVIIKDGGGISLNKRKVYGGITRGGGDVYKNRVILEEGGIILKDNILGGDSTGSGNVYENTVVISGRARYVYGGHSTGSGNVYKNNVLVDGRANNVYGGRTSGAGDVTQNKVDIRGTVVWGAGGYSSGKGNVSSNIATILAGGIVTDDIYGGYAGGSGNVLNNIVTIEKDGEVQRFVFGGSTSPVGTGSVTGNMVEVNGKANIIYGGLIENQKSPGEISNNFVVINGTANLVIGGRSYGIGDVSRNMVEINGIADNVYGGFANGLGNVSYNTVTIFAGGTANGTIYGGLSSHVDNSAEISNNSVVVYGTANNIVSGGGVFSNLSSAAIRNNSVMISGTVKDAVFGGYNEGSGSVDDNVITILSTAKLNGASLFGRNDNSGSGSGNILNVDRFYGNVEEINRFDTYNFVLDQLTSDLTFLKITGSVPTDIDTSDISFRFMPTFIPKNGIRVGSVITVISETIPNIAPNSLTMLPSPFVAYDYIASYDTGAFKLTITGLAPQPQTKALAEGFAAGLAFLGQAADVRSSFYFAPQRSRFIPFAKMIYGKQYISTGSSVNVKGFSAIAGLALNSTFDNGSQLVVGAFVEGGWGDYDSRNSFRNSASIKGSGDTEYYGGGLLARYATSSGLYGEGTFAAGKTETDFSTRDFAPGTHSKYDYSVPYYSAHVAVGKLFNMCDIFSLDLYGKYLWTRQAGDNVTVDGYRFKFKDADSHRVRAGGKLQATGMPQLQPYAGAAYEYEFSGRIKGSLYGMNLDKPSLRGGTGIGELGLVWSPTESGNFKVDLGAQGYVGKREGVSGGLTVSLSF